MTCKIIFKGEEKTLRFGMMAMQIMAEIVSQHGEVSVVEAMVYAGLRNGSYAKLEQPNYTFEDVVDYVTELRHSEDNGAKVFEAINTAMAESKDFTLLTKQVEKVEDESKKKKSRGVKSTSLHLAK